MSHCGFGGTLEYINFGFPLVCFLHFGDQIINSEVLCKVNSALYLPNKVIKLEIPVKKYEKPLFKAEDVTNKFRKVLEDPIYK